MRVLTVRSQVVNLKVRTMLGCIIFSPRMASRASLLARWASSVDRCSIICKGRTEFLKPGQIGQSPQVSNHLLVLVASPVGRCSIICRGSKGTCLRDALSRVGMPCQKPASTRETGCRAGKIRKFSSICRAGK